ncbi:MAG: DNA recombination protein RmuC [Patescibacteria group bacterium]
MSLLSIVFLLVGVIVGFVVAQVFMKNKNSEDLKKSLEESLASALPKITQSAGEQTALLAKEKLESASVNLKQDFQNKQMIIQDTIKRLHDELKTANEKLERAERERIGSFENLKVQISNQTKQTQDLINTTTKLQSVLSNNQTRGQFGEQVAENLLKMSGFVKGVDYLVQETQGEGSRPDFTVLLPNGTKINIDSKFPYQNLLKILDSKTEQEKAQYRKAFEQDIKTKIRQVTTRDYINQEENTVDFVILFVPNEMIFSYIYDKMNEIWIEGLEKKVVFAGPFSFTAILRMVRQAHDYFSVQKNLQTIIKYIQTFREEFGKYNEEFDKLGDRIESTNKQYQSVAQTRTLKLSRIVDKIELESGADNGADNVNKMLNPNPKESTNRML